MARRFIIPIRKWLSSTLVTGSLLNVFPASLAQYGLCRLHLRGMKHVDVHLAILPPFGPEGPPLGLACIAAALRQGEISVRAEDYNIRLYRECEEELGHLWNPEHKAAWVWASRLPGTIASFGDFFDRMADELTQRGAGIIGFSVHSDNRAATIELIRRVRARKPKVKIITGGLGVYGEDSRKSFPKGLVDYFVVGEGEHTIVELARALLKSEEPADIAGMVRPGQTLVERDCEQEQDQFATPTFEDFDLSLYTTPNLPLVMSRGCTKGCTLCNDRILMGKFRTRSAEHVFSEIKQHVEKLGVHNFMVNDLQITQNVDELLKLCRLTIDDELDIHWNANAAIGEELTPEVLQTLHRAGCHTLCLGVESGSDHVLKLMNKGTSAESAANTLRAVRDAQIICWINFVVGFPGETEDDLAETLAWIEQHAELMDEVSVLNACNILDHSILATRPDKYGILPPVDPDWFEVAWTGRDGNTPAVRQERLQKVKDVLDRLEIPIRQTNLGFVDEASHLAGEEHDVLLVLCPPFDVTHPPLELASAAAYLAGKALKSFALDLNIQEYIRAAEDDRALWQPWLHDRWADPESFAEYLQRLGIEPRKLAEQILEVKADRIYFHLVRGNLLLTREVMKAIRELVPQQTLIIGGAPTRIEMERDLFPEAICDFAIIGKTEDTLAELVQRQKNSLSTETLRGARWVDQGGDPRYLPREPLRELDKIGHPTFREFVPERYISPVLPIRMSWGCGFRCAFCSEQPREGTFRTRSAASVFAEMCHHHDTWDVFTFQFADLIIDGDLAVLAELCDRIIQSGRPFRWSGQMAPRADLTPELFAKMADAGCTMLRFGVESFSDDLLALMNKNYTSDEAKANLRDANAAGIEAHVNLILGFPGETEDDFLATVKALKEEQEVIDYVDEVTPCFILPGCAIERDSVKYEVLLPAGDHHRTWSHKSYNNFSWRETRAKEMAIWISGLDIKFNYEFFVPPNDPLREYADKIRQRLEAKITPAADVVLVTLPPWGYENPPVGLAYLSSYLRYHGAHTKVIDYNIRFYNSVHELYRMLWHVENKNYWSNEKTFEVVRYSLQGLIDEAVQELVALNPPLLGFSVVDPKERITIEVIKQFRKHNKSARIILGGPACFTPEYRQIFIDQAGDLIDGYAVGEGEETLLELVHRVRNGEDLRNIPGLMILDENKDCQLTPREHIMGLDSVPPPTYDEFDIPAYPGDSLILEWSRGCVGNCTFCKNKQVSGPYRTRSAKHIFGELKRHYEKHGYDNFTICDNLINGAPDVLDELCDRIIESGIKIRWNGEALPMASMSPELLDKMAQAGCYELQWGLESASDVVLKAMNKRRVFCADDVERVIRDSHKAGIKTCLFIIVGFPGESDDEWDKTMAFVRENAEWIDQVKSINSLHIITDTLVHRHADQFDLVLPERDYHYLWQTADGKNTPAVRNRRIRELLKLAQDLNVEVRETNLTEGKQNELAEAIADERLSMEERMKRLIDDINDLRSFELDTVEAGDRTEPTLPPEPEPPAIKQEPEPEEEAELDDDFVRERLALTGILDGEEVYATPELLEIDLTNFCNLNCIGCWNHSPLMREKQFQGEEKKRRLPLELVLKLIDDAAALGAKKVQLSGAGEPLCHPDALTIIEHIKKHGLHCTVITNGTTLNEKIIKRLVETGLDDLTVSVWAGTPAVYEATHPNQQGKTLKQIRDRLRLLHETKREQKVFAPKVKIYHVVNHVNAGDIEAMVDFAVDSLAEFIEFTPVDIVPGYTDELALTDQDRQLILAELRKLPQRADYLELDPTQGKAGEKTDPESKEFARFVKQSILPKGFKYELDDITRFDVLCSRKEWRLDVREDNEAENALLFFYPRLECENCPLNPKCEIDKDRYVVKVEFTSFLGFGAFYRRISTPAETGAYDAEKVDALPCCVGWTYARVKTDGAVIPCCKADRMPLGNLHEKDFVSIWTDAPYREFRRKALTDSKKDPYFDPIGCLVACDNLGQNVDTQQRLQELSEKEIAALRQAKDKGLTKL